MHEIELFFFPRWLLRRGRGNLIYSRSKHLHKTTFSAAVAVNLLILHTVTFERQRWQIRGEANKNKNRFPESNLSEVRDVQIRRLRNTANETSLAVFNLFSHRQLAQDDKELIMFSLFLTRTLCSALKHSPTLCHRSFRGSQGFDLLPTEDEFYPNDSPMSPQMQCITGRKLEENKKKWDLQFLFLLTSALDESARTSWASVTSLLRLFLRSPLPPSLSEFSNLPHSGHTHTPNTQG